MRWVICCCCCLLLVVQSRPVQAQPGGLSRQVVADSIAKAQRFLKSKQNNDGSWDDSDHYKVGVTSLVVMGLLNSQTPVTDPAVQRGLTFLRSIPPERWSLATEKETYELSLMLQALVAADDSADTNRIARLADRIERGQLTGGPNAGSWSYTLEGGDRGGDRSNGQFAILALREAAHYGIPIRRETWERARNHWIDSQNQDGGWGYQGSGGNQDPSRGSMTVAGIATLVISETMLGKGEDNIDCCAVKTPDEALERGINWLARNFSVGSNPGVGEQNVLYYLYGLERAGRLSGRRFFGENNDWYRNGAEYLTRMQHPIRGSWSGSGQLERTDENVLSTSFALLFLSKGLSPVVVSKLKFGGADGAKIPDDLWNRHQRDVHHLMEYISSRPGWPKLLTWQVIELNKLTDQTALPVLVQSPILFLSSDKAPLLTEEDVLRIRQYLDQGGTLLASAGCDSAEFDRGFRELVKRLYPAEANLFKKLTADHPIYRSEFLVPYDANELWGIDFGCRTPIIYSPRDLGCYWDYWTQIDPPRRSAKTRDQIDRMMHLGTNIVAYVTGREPADKLESGERATVDNPLEHIERGFLQIAKLRHEGGWDTAPMALHNLLKALNQEVGAVSTTRKDFVPSDKNIFNYPILYIHGRQSFSFGEQERNQLRTYLERGNVLFADACCGAPQFDKAFRAEMAKMFPDQNLERIPIEHDLMKTPFDIREVTRRLPAVNQPGQPLETISQKSEPVLYGISIDGRLAVIYSPYDLSCALERQASLICNGYESQDALHIAMNIVVYAMEENVPISP